VGREGKEGEAGRKEVYGSQGKVRRDGSGDCGRVATEESSVSKSSWHSATQLYATE